ncbi:hypothetical protein GGX14DRAFT_573693 [Mycena pura]|uniref:Uncharacterized protein n=1 Tax=Mycena pura TaxID=153505 RepID=A0AAD6V5Z2_9AGAR|nr:hypothetical protein GGX14DRAFT_573693 [Mycena pura]
MFFASHLPVSSPQAQATLTLQTKLKRHWRRTTARETRVPQPASEELPGRDFVLEGSYGGPTLNADEYESMLLFAGGSGTTFTLGALDARCIPLAPAGSARAPKTVRVVWSIRAAIARTSLYRLLLPTTAPARSPVPHCA